METFLYGAAVTLGVAVVAAYFIVSALTLFIVGYVVNDVLRTIRIKRARRNELH
jgi:hypothetical protein